MSDRAEEKKNWQKNRFLSIVLLNRPLENSETVGREGSTKSFHLSLASGVTSANMAVPPNLAYAHFVAELLIIEPRINDCLWASLGKPMPST